MKVIIWTMVVLGCCLSGPAPLHAGSPAVDELIPPVLGGRANIKQPEAVKKDGCLISAANAQDAANAAVQHNVDTLKTGGTGPEVGATMMRFPSGIGFVASGQASYGVFNNPSATRREQRRAYIAAFSRAKKNLAGILSGLSSEAKDEIREHLVSVSLPEEDRHNLARKSDESLTQAVNMLLRGYVVYAVKDDATAKLVTVSIVTTPKTRRQCAHVAPGVLEVEDLRDALSQVLAEVCAGVVPPVGGRIVLMRKTGETAFVGFGAHVVGTSSTPALQSQLRFEAMRIAEARSKDSLAGMLIGDQVAWRLGLTDKSLHENREFQETADADALGAIDRADGQRLRKAREDYIARVEKTEVYTSIRKGQLPPGIHSRPWLADDGWAYCVSVCAPSLTQAATQTAAEMLNADILAPRSSTEHPSTEEVKPDVRPGPTGQVTDDKGL